MFFNSPEFLLFFVVVIFAYFALPQKFRWIFLLGASYLFYMCWKAEYAILILTTTFIVYITGLLMHKKSQNLKKFYVALSIISNLGILFAFKYFNFFNSSLKSLVTSLGFEYSVPMLGFLLPVGISFYTFQALSYTIDIYRGDREPERHFGIFALYVSFFPQLVAGPIERSTTLMPQFYKKVEFDYDRVVRGLQLMAWGFFQKVVIADRLGAYVDSVYSNPTNFFGQPMYGIPLIIGTYFFVFQVYCDFSGYTDIAIGAAQVMGYELMPNFRRPYFARTIDDLWRRWHMSLIMWFRDYLYIPLGGSRVPKWRYYFNIITVFTLSGLWHGAQWTFVSWGFFNGLLIALGRLFQGVKDKTREAVIEFIQWVPSMLYVGIAILLAFYAFTGDKIGLAKSMSLVSRILILLPALLVAVFGWVKMRGVKLDRFFDRAVYFWQVFVTFNLFAVGAIFFRARSFSDGWHILTNLSFKNAVYFKLYFSFGEFFNMILVIIIINAVHILQEKYGSVRTLINKQKFAVRWTIYYSSLVILFLGLKKSAQFIYFQF